jgi:hypothetical protein
MAWEVTVTVGPAPVGDRLHRAVHLHYRRCLDCAVCGPSGCSRYRRWRWPWRAYRSGSESGRYGPSCGKDAPDAREDCPAGATGEGPPLPARDWRVQDLIVDGSGLGGVHVPGGRTPLERFALQAGQGPTAALRLGQRAGDDGPGDDTVRSLPPPVLDGGPPCPCPCSCPWSSLGGFFLGFAAPGSRSWQ